MSKNEEHHLVFSGSAKKQVEPTQMFLNFYQTAYTQFKIQNLL